VAFKISTLENVFQAAPQQAPASNFIIEYGQNERPKSEEQPKSSKEHEKDPSADNIVEEITRNPNDECIQETVQLWIWFRIGRIYCWRIIISLLMICRY
jgi:hypothetical protein